MSIRERQYIDQLEVALTDEYGSYVEREPRLPSDREPDFLLHLWPIPVAVEVENTAEDCIGGAGQALLYAAETGYAPAVIFPGPHTEETLLLDQFMPMVAVDPDGL